MNRQKCRDARVLAAALAVGMMACGAAETSVAFVDSGLPGAPAVSDELRRQLISELAAKGDDYRPRTHHLDEDGAPKFVNRLILESSPYLLQHAHNPVNWYPWGDEAFAAAKALGRPILLSIGYSTCHWCHVMEEESFEDVEIATYLNTYYIPIKVDREERPDLDSIYMRAVQMLTGRGGWPMTTWLTPDREPFFGGTYFPARDGDRGTRQGFLTLLRRLREAYDEQPDRVAATVKQVTEGIRKGMLPASGETLPGADSVRTALSHYRRVFDPVYGGRKQAPKFPSSFPVRLLLREYRRSGEDAYLDMAILTLTKMAQGGMYDQIGGGFHRYSTDARWLVPHFEKMLYDNALLIVAYLEGFQLTGDEDLARIARETLRYVEREMTAPGGGFYSATDADSLNPAGEREEGWFFTWTPSEIREVLGEADASLLEAHYGVSEGGNFEGRNILNVTRPVSVLAGQLDQAADGLRKRIDAAREKMYVVRLKRPAPLLDDKILTSWNGLMISAFAKGGFVLDAPALIVRAERAADFVLEHLEEDGRLRRSFKDAQARHNAYLDDYAFFGAGLLDLYEATSSPRWLSAAIKLQKTLDQHYSDAAAGGYFMTSDDHEALLAREKPASDGAEPSGNSIALMNLSRLHELTTDDRYRVAAERLLRRFSGSLSRTPTALSDMLLALDFRLGSPKEVVIVTPGARADADEFLSVLRRTFVPNKVVAVVRQADVASQVRLVPLLQGKVAKGGKATAYVCERGVCKLPTTDVEVFSRQLEQTKPSADAS